jgi:hypothetical protein
MDLDYHNRHDLADDVISEYIAASQDFDVIKLIVFYKIYRAFVRGKVESFRMKDTGIDPAERDGAGIRAGQYFRLAYGYIMRLALGQTVFITCGLMGSGKSTLAQQLGFELGITPVSSDLVRKQLAGIAADEQSRVDFETGLYSREMSDETYSRLLQVASDEVSHGRSVIIDACCVQKHQRQRFSALALSFGVQLVILQLSCSEAENKRRLAAREAAGSSNSDGRLELLGQQAALFEPPDDTEGRIISISAALSPSAMTREIYRGLELTC